MKQYKNNQGFTLLELLIVIAIIAILSVILILVLNPAEALKKSRDVQRISDLNTVKTALGLYMTSTSTPMLDNTAGNTLCVGGSGADTLFLSTTGITDATPPTSPTTFVFAQSATTTVDGLGWLPVNLASLTGGSPISNMPSDPTNNAVSGASTLAALTNDALIYRYACKASPLGFEIDAKLESAAYTVDEVKATKDGGNNANLYEVGTDLATLPSTTDF